MKVVFRMAVLRQFVNKKSKPTNCMSKKITKTQLLINEINNIEIELLNI